MSKRMKIFALSTIAAALFVAPAFASAQEWHLDKTGAFTISGGAISISSAAGATTTCTSVSGSGSYTTATTGSLQLVFHGCTSSGFSCNSAGQPAGTVKTTVLPIHNAMIATSKPGMLVTPNSVTNIPTTGMGHYFSKSCAGGLVNSVVSGNGLLGTITAPACGGSSKTLTLVFEQASAGVQKHLMYTGTTYDLVKSVNNGAHSTTSLQAALTLTFSDGAARKVECT